jgi:hypothetical protein
MKSNQMPWEDHGMKLNLLPEDRKWWQKKSKPTQDTSYDPNKDIVLWMLKVLVGFMMLFVVCMMFYAFTAPHPKVRIIHVGKNEHVEVVHDLP